MVEFLSPAYSGSEETGWKWAVGLPFSPSDAHILYLLHRQALSIRVLTERAMLLGISEAAVGEAVEKYLQRGLIRISHALFCGQFMLTEEGEEAIEALCLRKPEMFNFVMQ